MLEALGYSIAIALSVVAIILNVCVFIKQYLDRG